jgi:hypothetical protein
MGYTVTRPGGTKDVEFEEYAQLLRRRGVDLARLPRVPEPGSGRRWLYVWDSPTEAQAFADELKRQTEDASWEVAEVDAAPSEGPLGPVEIQAARRRDGWAFALHPLSRLMIRKLFPDSCRTGSVSIRSENGDKAASAPPVADLAEQVAVLLTGLSLEQITTTFGGYRVYDPVKKRELVASAPVHA